MSKSAYIDTAHNIQNKHTHKSAEIKRQRERERKAQTPDVASKYWQISIGFTSITSLPLLSTFKI